MQNGVSFPEGVQLKGLGQDMYQLFQLNAVRDIHETAILSAVVLNCTLSDRFYESDAPLTDHLCLRLLTAAPTGYGKGQIEEVVQEVLEKAGLMDCLIDEYTLSLIHI